MPEQPTTESRTSASLGQLAVRAELISRDQCQALRRYQLQRNQAGRPISFARMLLAAGVGSRELRKLLRSGQALDQVLCDSCGQGLDQSDLTSRREYPCSCGSLVMPFRPFAKQVASLRETLAYADVLPLPGDPDTSRYDQVLVAPIELEGEPTLHFRDVINLPDAAPRGERETLTAYRALIEQESTEEARIEQAPTLHHRKDANLDLPAVGPFELEKVIGEGSVGRVYLGRHRETGEVAAVKVLRPETAEDEEYLARFQREARAAAMIDHPNLVRVVEAGYDEEKKLHYLGMEHLTRGSLGELLKHTPIVVERRALEIAKDVCEALVAASEAGIVHRDVKPHNVLFDRQGRAKLADLGMAFDLGDESRITATGVVVGTPLYIAPEQATGKAFDARADLYALGLCLYEMLSGKQAFAEDGAPPLEIIVRHLKEELSDVRLANPNVSDDAAQLVRGLCAREVHDRYPTPAAALRDLILVLDGHHPLGPGDATPASALSDPTVRVKLPAEGLPPPKPAPARPSEALAGEAPAKKGGGLLRALLALATLGGLAALVVGLYFLLGRE